MLTLLLASALAPPPAQATSPATAPPAKPAAAAKPASGESNTVQGLTVTGDTQAYRSAIDRKSYGIEKDLQATTGSIADVLRNVPSVDVDVQGKVSLRGDANVTILVDGQPSTLFSGPNRGDILLQLPASQYERVEVMTNPSAAFSPDGTAGIINLISKKGRGAGRTGTVKANIGTEGRYNTGVSGSYNDPKLTLTGSLNYRHDSNAQDGKTQGALIDPGTGRLASYDKRNRADAPTRSVFAQGGVGYDVDAKTRLSADAVVGVFDTGTTASGFSRTTGGPALALESYDQSASAQGRGNYESASATYLRKFTGAEHEFSLRLGLNHNKFDFDSRLGFDYLSPSVPDRFQDVDVPAERTTLTAKAEYKRPLPHDAKLVAGYELQDDRGEFETRSIIGTTAADAAPSPALSNLFRADQAINAVYATYQQAFGALTVLPGLRLEEVFVDTNQVTQAAKGSFSYFNAYPTVHLNYALDADRKLSASFSRRVQRPDLSSLNPFITYQSPLSFTQGNPRLRPQVTESFEAGYEYRHLSTNFQANLFYRQNHDQFSPVTRDLGGGVFLATQGNLGQSRAGGLELVQSGKLPWKLSYNMTTTVFWNEIDATNLVNGQNSSNVTANWRGTLNWEPTDKDYLQLTGSARGRYITAQGYSEPYGSLNLGYRRKLTDKLSGVITANDLLGTAQFISVIDTPTLKQRSRFDPHSRSLYVGVSYAFGAAGKRRPETFDFGSGASSGPQ